MCISITPDDNCQYWKNLDEMKLSSPNYPKFYPEDGVECQWIISAQEGFIIALEFNHFDVSFGWNDEFNTFVSLYDGTCDQTKELETLSGTMSNDDKWIISSSGHHMFVIFSKSQYFGQSKQGFLANIHYGKKLKDIKIVHK